ncbi:MAG: AAA family ATPase [Cyclobacteriaceae bacterium]|nr:AAA family ATPase [Cyclobacteriaceae bacterium]
MEQILRKSNILVQNQSSTFTRSLAQKVDWSDRLIGILGARGTGKTTLLLQRLKQQFGITQAATYLSLDDIYFTENRLVDFAESFLQQGGEMLFIDEVHKYPDWSREIKNLYDTYSNVKIVFTGSSITDLLRQNADLSRRAVQYHLPGLSYREYLSFTGVATVPALNLTDIVEKHTSIALDLMALFKPLQHLPDYLKKGYYPFFAENLNTYYLRLEQLVKMVIETDMRFIDGFDSANTRKIYQLLYILATNVPFKPNITKLAEKIGIHRNTLVQYLTYLDKARLTNSLVAAGKSISTLQKPDKLFLENTNLHYALSPTKADKGSLREAFFLNQFINNGHRVALPSQGDFLVDEIYTFEVGGKDKSSSQLRDLTHSFVAADDIENGTHNKIPLWLFGFMY